MSAAGAEARQRRRLLRASATLPTFDPRAYVALNDDLAEVEPYGHYARFGAWEGRRSAFPEGLTAALAVAVAVAPEADRLDAASADAAWRAAERLAVAIRLPGDADAAARDAADLCAERLQGVGATVRRTTGGSGGEGKGSARELLVDAPGLLGDRRPEGAAADRLARAAVWLPGAPGEAGFTAALPFALCAGAVVCAEADAYAAIVHAGGHAVWLGRPPRDPRAATEPPDHPLIAGLSRAVRAAPPGLPWAERPIALSALEDATPARTEAWVRMADDLAEAALVLRRPAGPEAHLPNEAEVRRWVYARSRVVLHLHAEAPRAVSARAAGEAADAGAALLCEPSPAHLLLRPGVHYAEASARRMAARLADLAQAPDALGARLALDLRARMAAAFDEERVGLQLALALHRAGEAP